MHRHAPRHLPGDPSQNPRGLYTRGTPPPPPRDPVPATPPGTPHASRTPHSGPTRPWQPHRLRALLITPRAAASAPQRLSARPSRPPGRPAAAPVPAVAVVAATAAVARSPPSLCRRRSEPHTHRYTQPLTSPGPRPAHVTAETRLPVNATAAHLRPPAAHPGPPAAHPGPPAAHPGRPPRRLRPPGGQRGRRAGEGRERSGPALASQPASQPLGRAHAV